MSFAVFPRPSSDDADRVDSDSEDSVDATDVLFRRGEMMRMLREMEMEDEAARREAMATEETGGDADGDGETLNYERYLSHQSYYDDFKHVNYKYIDFGPVREGQDSLIVRQDRSLGKGGLCWDAAFVLAEHVVNEHQNLPCFAQEMVLVPEKCKRIVELGSGTGVCGLLLARAFPTTVHVDMTDLPEIMPLIESNSKTVPNTSSFALKWGEPIKNSPTDSTKYDIIIAADVIASIYDPTALLQTINDLSHEGTWVYLSGKDRLVETVEPFERCMRQMFAHVERQTPNSRNRNPHVFVIVAHGKRNLQ